MAFYSKVLTPPKQNGGDPDRGPATTRPTRPGGAKGLRRRSITGPVAVRNRVEPPAAASMGRLEDVGPATDPGPHGRVIRAMTGVGQSRRTLKSRGITLGAVPYRKARTERNA